MLVSKPWNIKYAEFKNVLDSEIFRLTKNADSTGSLKNYNSGDGYAHLEHTPLPYMNPEHGYDVRYNITAVRSLGQGETRYISDIVDGYEVSVPNHCVLKIVTVKFSIQGQDEHDEISVLAQLGNLEHRIRNWYSFREALQVGAETGVLKVYPISTSSVIIKNRITPIAMFDVEFTIPVNDLEIDRSEVIESVDIDGYYQQPDGYFIESLSFENPELKP